jgi:hypothetical protein
VTNADFHAARRAAFDAFNAAQLAKMVTPPADVLNRPPTADDVHAYPIYFILGPGADIASHTDCGHGYNLTDSCPICP